MLPAAAGEVTVLEFDEGLEVLFGHDHLFGVDTQDVVESLGDGVADKVQEAHQGLDDGGHPGGDLELVGPDADGLGEDLPEDEHDRGRDQDGQTGGHDGVEEDGQGLHGQRVGQEEGGQQQVAVVNHFLDFPGLQLFLFGPVLLLELQGEGVDRGVADGQAGHQSRKARDHWLPHGKSTARTSKSGRSRRGS